AVQTRLTKIDTELLPDARKGRDAINERAGVILEALKLIDPSKQKLPDRCPVCEQTIDAGHVRQHLEQWQEEMKGALGPIQGEIGKLEKEQVTLNNAIGQFNRLEEHIKQKEEPVIEARKAIAIVLTRDIAEGEDPLVLIDEEIQKVDADLE